MVPASNLGQILGRALYGELAPAPRPEFLAAAEAARREEETRRALAQETARAESRLKDEARAERSRENLAAARGKRWSAPKPKAQRARRGKTALVEAALKAHPEGLTLPQLRARTGVSTTYLVEALRHLPIEKSGKRRHYVYRLKHG